MPVNIVVAGKSCGGAGRKKKTENVFNGQMLSRQTDFIFFLNHDSVLTVAAYSSGCSIVALNGI